MIDRYLLRYFLAVVDTGTFSRAAAQSNVSQPTLSAGIAKLERLLDHKLFERTSQRVSLTEAGTHLLLHARRIEGEFNRAEAAVRGMEPSRSLRLGVLTTIASHLLASLVIRARAIFPDIKIELVEGNERTLLQSLGRGRVDMVLGLVRGTMRRFATEALWEEAYVLALPAAHAMAGEPIVAAEALARDAMIVRSQCEALSETSRHFTERSVRPFFSLRTSSDNRALAMVRAGLGVTVVPEFHQMEGVLKPALAGFNQRRTIGLLWNTDTEGLVRSLAPLFEPLKRASLDSRSGGESGDAARRG